MCTNNRGRRMKMCTKRIALDISAHKMAGQTLHLLIYQVVHGVHVEVDPKLLSGD